MGNKLIHDWAKDILSDADIIKDDLEMALQCSAFSKDKNIYICNSLAKLGEVIGACELIIRATKAVSDEGA